MGLLDRIAGTPQVRAVYRAARRELERVSRREGCESDAVVAANAAVAAAEKNLPAWRRVRD